ncbi:MAG TPA: hypothetical protein VF699_09995 [Caulobacteraceae bacterium]|jgi:hypothetical protein
MRGAEYRKNAEANERLAHAADKPEIREEYLRIAAGWRALAESAERQQKASPPEESGEA